MVKHNSKDELSDSDDDNYSNLEETFIEDDKTIIINEETEVELGYMKGKEIFYTR